MNTDTMEKFFKDAFNVDYIDMDKNTYINVKDKNIGILSFDKQSNKNIYKRVNKLIRKDNSLAYEVSCGKNTFLCSENHRVAIKFDLNEDFSFIEIKDLFKIKDNYYSLTQDNKWEKIVIVKTKEKIPILDLEVEDTHCYYTNGILSHNSYGNPETTSGGVSLQFYASVRFDVRRKEVIGNKEDPDGFVTKIKLAKNKCGPPFKVSYVDLYIGKNGVYGIDNFSEVVTLAIEKNIIKQAGAWFKYDRDGTEERFQGKQKVIQYLKDNTDIFDRIKVQVFDKSIIENKPIKGSLKDEQDKQAEKIAEKTKELKKPEGPPVRIVREGENPEKPKRIGRPSKKVEVEEMNLKTETEEMNLTEEK